MSALEKKSGLDVIATTCIKVVEETVKGMSALSFTKDSDFLPREIIEYESRMRVFGMEKFNGPCYVSVVNYYLSSEDLKKHDAYGVFILYLEDGVAGRILKSLGYKGFDEDDEADMFKTMGEFCQVVATNYKNELMKLGYKDLLVSAPLSYHNNIPEGVEFSYDQYNKYEMSFYIWKEKALVVDVTLGPSR